MSDFCWLKVYVASWICFFVVHPKIRISRDLGCYWWGLEVSIHSPLFFGGSNRFLSCKFQGGKWIINAKAVEWYYITSRDLPRLDPNGSGLLVHSGTRRGNVINVGMWWWFRRCDECLWNLQAFHQEDNSDSDLSRIWWFIFYHQRCTYILSEPKLLIFRWAWGFLLASSTRYHLWWKQMKS